MTTDQVSPPLLLGSSPKGGDTSQRAAQLIAENLGALPHPGNADQKGRIAALAMFNTKTLPPDLAKAVTATAQMVGEAIVNLLASNGMPPTEKTPQQPPEPPAAVALCAHGHPVALTAKQLNNLKAH